jgi:S-(hydroxymethyl)glutathione dehydrogenase/alcohol dehydrogenase
MKTRAAVAFEAKKPLEIVEVDLEGPRAGEVLVEIKATGICHTDAYTLDGLDSEGIFPSILGHEGAGIVLEVGAGVTSVVPGDHVIPLYTPECRQCKSCLSRKTNLCTAIRATQGKGQMPDGTSRFSYKGQPIAHYMGCSTFANHTVLPEIALAKVRDDAPFDKICYIGCGVTTGVGAVLNTAKVEQGATAAVFGLGGIGLNVIQGLKMAGADKIIGVDINDDKADWGRKFGMTHFVNPTKIEGDVVPHIVGMTKTPFDKIGGVDYSFDCTGNVKVMRAALECTHRGWGQSIVIGVAPAGAVIETRPFQLVTGRVWKGTAFGGARGRTDVPKIVDWYMDGKIEIDSMITHVLPLERINEGFDLMHAGKSIRAVVVY